jgi:hypothetical protein
MLDTGYSIGIADRQNVIEPSRGGQVSRIQYRVSSGNSNQIFGDRRPATSNQLQETSDQLEILFKKVFFLADLIRGFGILSWNRSVFKAFKNNIF